MTHPSPKRNMVPKVVLMRSGLVSLTTARPVNIAQPRTTVNSAKPMTNVNTARPKAVLNFVKGNHVNAVKASACWGNPQMDLQEKGVIDSGCSRHMTGNMSYLTDFEEIDGRYVAFEGNSKRGKITDRAERKNRTLIEAARTMLADSKLPTTFWAEAVNTACYVQNRVLVTKPHNKTPYELFLGRKLALGFMRPFGCLVTILNTIDHLGKFDGKADEGFFVGYSINSKAFRVFNSRTRIVEENISPNVGFKPLGYDEKKATEEPKNEGGDSSKDGESYDQEKEDNVNSTDTVNAASTNKVNVVGVKTSIKLPDDPNMPELEDIVYLDNNEDVGAEADMNNLDAFMPVSPILTTRIHKDHPVEQIIGDLNSAPQTRRMTKNLEEHEPKKVIHALKDPSWIEAMQEELLQFKLQEVWTLVELPNGKRAIGTKWVFRNKKDERGILIKNKARLVAQGYTQEKGIDYKIVFADIDVKSAFLYGKIEEEVYRGKIDKTLFIRGDKGDILLVQVYVDDIIFSSTKKSLCIEFEKLMHKKFQMSSMGELIFFLGPQVKQKEDGIFISQDKYVTDSFGRNLVLLCKDRSNTMETQKLLLKDEDGE
ncbi:putative ribonuclease H-like domain-containing protein [Tanacetum coccineum]